jgi:hypothetical protein
MLTINIIYINQFFTLILENKKHMSEEDISNYKSYCKVLGYISKINAYSSIYKNIHNDLDSFRSSIINRHLNTLNVEEIKKLAIPIENNKWYKQGIYNFETIKKTLIDSYLFKIESILESENITPETTIDKKISEENLKKIEFLILSIISIDVFYDIYEETINVLVKKYLVFNELMYTDFCHHLML